MLPVCSLTRRVTSGNRVRGRGRAASSAGSVGFSAVAKASTSKRPPVRRRPGAPTKAAIAARPAGVRGWIGAARPRTLPLAIAPVALGTGAVWGERLPGTYWLAFLALAVALLLQIGVNFANDYSDGIRGTDRYRVGPSRLTASGAAKPRTVLIAAIVCFVLAAARGRRDRPRHAVSGGCSRSVPPRSPRPGSTRAASARTATPASARSPSSCSSASRRRPARASSSPASCPPRAGSAPSRSAASPPRCSS